MVVYMTHLPDVNIECELGELVPRHVPQKACQ